MLRCTIDVRLVMLSTHTIHWNPTCSRVISITLISSSCFLLLSSLIFLHLDWLDLQSPLLIAVHLTGKCAASPVAAEVWSDVDGAYRAHAKVNILSV